MQLLRSILFNVAFYLNTLFWALAGVPTFLMTYRQTVWIAKQWGRVNLWLLRVIAGIRVEYRGLEKIPSGPLIVASKHHSAWETFALFPLFDDPLYILKRELMFIPIFGWLTWKGRMIAINRKGGAAALAAMTDKAARELNKGRQLIIFPEGTRRPAGAEPRYKYGVAHLYEAAKVPCLPAALNSGLFWPRRTFMRVPGTVVVQFLDLIPPGLPRDEFHQRLQDVIEAASDKLLDEGRAEIARAAAQ